MISKRYSYIRKYLFIFSILFLLSGCDIVDAIIGGGDEDSNNQDDNFTLIGSQTIGINGGEINLDSIIVEIPYGAFDNDNNISIHVGFDNDGFDEYGITSLFQLQGLPTTINKPIRLSIKHLGAIEGDTLIAIGEMQYATSLDSSLYSYHTENASDSLGFLVYDFPAKSSLSKITQPQNNILTDYINFIGLGEFKKSKSSNGNFILSYSLAHETNAIKMGEHFEKVYDTCKNMGFSLAGRDFQLDPAPILATTLLPNIGGYYSSSYYINNMTDADLRSLISKGKFVINLIDLSDDLKLRTTCGHEFLHLVQNLYEFSSSIEPEQKWLMEASSTWIMEKFANVINYIPYPVPGRELYPLVGWQFNVAPSFEHPEIGYGLAIIFKDIADRYGTGEIVKIFQNIKDGILPNNAVDPVEAVKSVVEKWEPLEDFWHGVLSEYILGNYYNKQINFKLLKKTSDWHKSGTIDPQNNKLVFNETARDLSGILFKITPGDFSGQSTVPLSIYVDDPNNCGLLVCKYKQDSEITLIGEVYPGGSGQISIDDAKPIFDAGYELMILVSNGSHDKNKNYFASRNIMLTVEIISPEILNGKMKFFLDQAVTNRTSSRGIEEILHFNDLKGSFSNNIFNGNYWYQSLGRTFSGDVRITFIDNPESINFHLYGQYTYESLFGFGTVTFRYTVDYDGIPYQGLEGEYVQYHVYSESGSAVQNGQFTWSETNSQWTENLISYDCGDGAYIRVEVDKRE